LADSLPGANWPGSEKAVNRTTFGGSDTGKCVVYRLTVRVPVREYWQLRYGFPYCRHSLDQNKTYAYEVSKTTVGGCQDFGGTPAIFQAAIQLLLIRLPYLMFAVNNILKFCKPTFYIT